MPAEESNGKIRVVKITEIFKSIQGESSYCGRPCVFVRLSGCNLRCSYCDTRYAQDGGEEITAERVLEKIFSFDCPLVEFTGGEPLLQDRELSVVADELISRNYTVLLETNGTVDIAKVNREIIKVMDIKCPGSGMSVKMRWENLDGLDEKDEVKFVLLDKTDYDWAANIIKKHNLTEKLNVLMYPVHLKLNPGKLAEWILADNLDVRLGVQLHKYINMP